MTLAEVSFVRAGNYFNLSLLGAQFSLFELLKKRKTHTVNVQTILKLHLQYNNKLHSFFGAILKRSSSQSIVNARQVHKGLSSTEFLKTM